MARAATASARHAAGNSHRPRRAGSRLRAAANRVKPAPTAAQQMAESGQPEQGQGQQRAAASGSRESDGPEAEGAGQVVVEKALKPDPAVGQHGQQRRRKPRGTLCQAREEEECAPEKEENRRGHGCFLGEGGAADPPEPLQPPIEQNVRILRHDLEAERLTRLDEKDEPGVVEMAGEVARLDMLLQKHGRDKQKRHRNVGEEAAPHGRSGARRPFP